MKFSLVSGLVILLSAVAIYAEDTLKLVIIGGYISNKETASRYTHNGNPHEILSKGHEECHFTWQNYTESDSVRWNDTLRDSRKMDSNAYCLWKPNGSFKKRVQQLGI